MPGNAITFYVDGGMLGRRNPCPAGVRWSVFCYPPGTVVLREQSVTHHTNNEAEWLAVRAALRYARQYYPNKVIHIRSDSRLVVNQFNGRWRAKDFRMHRFLQECRELARTLSACYISWRPRHEMVRRLGH